MKVLLADEDPLDKHKNKDDEGFLTSEDHGAVQLALGTVFFKDVGYLIGLHIFNNDEIDIFIRDPKLILIIIKDNM